MSSKTDCVLTFCLRIIKTREGVRIAKRSHAACVTKKNHARDRWRMSWHLEIMAGARCGGKRKQKGAASFTLKDRKAMLEDFRREMLGQPPLLGDRHLDRYEDRQAFIASICSETVKPVQCKMEMVARYTEGMRERQQVCEVRAAVV